MTFAARAGSVRPRWRAACTGAACSPSCVTPRGRMWRAVAGSCGRGRWAWRSVFRPPACPDAIIWGQFSLIPLPFFSPWPKSIREAEELFLADRAEYFYDCLLHDRLLWRRCPADAVCRPLWRSRFAARLAPGTPLVCLPRLPAHRGKTHDSQEHGKHNHCPLGERGDACGS